MGFRHSPPLRAFRFFRFGHFGDPFAFSPDSTSRRSASPASCRGAAIAHRSIDEYVPASSQPHLQSFRHQACLEAVFLLPASSGALWVAVLSFPLRLEPDLDQAADGFGATDLDILLGNPGIDCSNLPVMHAHDLRLTGPRGLR